MKFRYEAYDHAGKRRVGALEGESAEVVREQLARDGMFPTEIAPLDEHASQALGARPALGLLDSLRAGTYLVPLVDFSRELSVLVSNGTPVVDAISALERQCGHQGFRDVIKDVRSKVEEGVPLSEAMGRHPLAFDQISVSLVAAGESGADLDAMLERLSEFAIGRLHIRKTVMGAMLYPAALLTISTLVMVALFVFVLPRFAEMFETMQVELPASTAAMMALGDAVASWWWAMIIGMAGGVVGAAFWLRTPSGLVVADRVMLRLPVIGLTIRSFSTARIARIVGTLIEARVPFLDALALAKRGLASPSYIRLLDRAEELVSKGDTVAAAFADSALISPSFAEAIRNAERTGRLGPVMGAMATHMEADNEALLKSVTKLAEPLILAALGVIVGFVAISLFLPLFDLTASAGGGGAP
ncbi:MAG: type II secretion system F family protein [Phycisphaerales bacterium]